MKTILTHKEIVELGVEGYSYGDVLEIEENAHNCRIYKDGVRISKDKARKALTRQQFVSGIARSLFHRTAERPGGITFINESFFKD